MKNLIVVVAVFSTCLLFSEVDEEKKYQNVTVGEVVAAMTKDKELIVIDVRTPKEFAEGHVAGARCIDMKERDFKEEIEALDRAKHYLVYCRSGGRSRKALAIFKELGFENVLHMDEGFLGWLREGEPVSK